MGKIINRALRAALLDQEFYKEAGEDNTLNQEALLMVILVSVIGGIGAFIAGLMIKRSFGAAVLGLSVLTAIGIANYYIWVYSTHFTCINVFQSEVELNKLLRVLGYASSPMALSLFSFIPYFGPLIGLIGSVWSLIAGFTGVQQTMNLKKMDTFATVVFGWLAILIIKSLVTNILGINVAGLGILFSSPGL